MHIYFCNIRYLLPQRTDGYLETVINTTHKIKDAHGYSLFREKAIKDSIENLKLDGYNTDDMRFHIQELSYLGKDDE